MGGKERISDANANGDVMIVVPESPEPRVGHSSFKVSGGKGGLRREDEGDFGGGANTCTLDWAGPIAERGSDKIKSSCEEGLCRRACREGVLRGLSKRSCEDSTGSFL